MAKDTSTEGGAAEFDPVEYKVRPDFSLVADVRADDTAEQVEEKVEAAKVEALKPPEEPPAEEPAP
jgi:hypothetical protein